MLLPSALCFSALLTPNTQTRTLVQVANACLKHIKEYKLVVHELERFVRKASGGQAKVLGLYAIDAALSKVRAKAAKGGEDKVHISS
jgi:hypothetical protein